MASLGYSQYIHDLFPCRDSSGARVEGCFAWSDSTGQYIQVTDTSFCLTDTLIVQYRAVNNAWGYDQNEVVYIDTLLGQCGQILDTTSISNRIDVNEQAIIDTASQIRNDFSIDTQVDTTSLSNRIDVNSQSIIDTASQIRGDIPTDTNDIDSTRLSQDSILIYYFNGSETGRDTIAGVGGGTQDLQSVTDEGATTTNNITVGGLDINGDFRVQGTVNDLIYDNIADELRTIPDAGAYDIQGADGYFDNDLTVDGNVGVNASPHSNVPLSLQGNTYADAIRIFSPDGTGNRTMGLTNDDRIVFRAGVNGDDIFQIYKIGGFSPGITVGTSTDQDFRIDLSDEDDINNYEDEFIRFGSSNNFGETSGGIIWKINFGGYDKINASIVSEAEANFGRQGLVFKTTDVADKTTDAIERMRISMGGNVGINESLPSFTLDVNGDARIVDEFYLDTTPSDSDNSATGILVHDDITSEVEKKTIGENEIVFGTASGGVTSNSNGAFNFSTTPTDGDIYKYDSGSGLFELVEPFTEGSGAPSTTPDFKGQIYNDTTGNTIYMAVDTTGSGDWIQLN